MKRARADDYWRGLYDRKGHLAITVKAQNVVNLPIDEINLSGPISIVTGLNGVGKSTLIHSLLIAMRRPHVPPSFPALRAQDATIEVSAKNADREIKCSAAVKDGEIRVEPLELELDISYIDTAFEVPALIKLFNEEKNLEEALRQSASRDLSAEELNLLSGLVGKVYEKCTIYELEDFSDAPVIPYTTVTAYGREYGTTGMGLGEAALHYFVWHLSRLRPNSLLLIEEPESYISTRAQANLMDLIARACVHNNAKAVISTHSPDVFANIRPEDTIILYREGANCRAHTAPSHDVRLIALGIAPRAGEAKDGVVLVEDRMARIFAVTWIKHHERDVLSRFKIVDTPGGAGQVLGIITKFPQVPEWIRIVGLLDGDEKQKGHQVDGPLCYLPGDVAPEIELRKIISSEPAEFAGKLRIDAGRLGVMLNAIEGSDHHDWFIELQKMLDVSFESVVEAAFACWIEVPENLAEAEAAFAVLKTALSEQ